MKASARLVTLAFVLASAGCITHGSSFDHSADFKKFTTWAWITEDAILKTQTVVSGSIVPVNPMLETMVRNSVESTLKNRGWVRVALDEADLIATFAVGARDEQQYSGYGYGGSSVTRTRGNLAIDFFQRTTKRAVWNGWATESMIAGKQMEQAHVQKIIDVILDQFPWRNTLAETGSL